jgi:hypothetical protein
VKKHFELEIADERSGFARRQGQIDAEARLDGIYVLRTSEPRARLEPPEVVRAYKRLKEVERAFGGLKGPLEVRPIHHRREQRVRAHVFLCCSPTTSTGTCARRGRSSPSPTSAPDRGRSGGQGVSLRGGRAQGAPQAHGGRRRGALLPQPARGARPPHARHDPRRGSEASFTQLSEPTELQARALALVDAKMPKLT